MKRLKALFVGLILAIAYGCAFSALALFTQVPVNTSTFTDILILSLGAVLTASFTEAFADSSATDFFVDLLVTIIVVVIELGLIADDHRIVYDKSDFFKTAWWIGAPAVFEAVVAALFSTKVSKYFDSKES